MILTASAHEQSLTRNPYRSFRRWLVDQRHRPDGVGDLARDSIIDRTRPSFRSLPEWVEYIGGRDGLAYQSLIRGWREFVCATESTVRERRDRRPSRVRLVEPKGRTISLGRRTRILERDGFRCRRCGTGPRDERLVVDHIMPVALGGKSNDENLQTLCEPCNVGKGARPPHPHDYEAGR